MAKYRFNDPKAAFAEALKRIQHALKSGAKKLDLRHLGLTELPESIGHLNQLRRLALECEKMALCALRTEPYFGTKSSRSQAPKVPKACLP